MANFKEISNPCPVGWSSGLKDLDTYKDHWPHVAFKIGVTSATHPFDLAKTLIQIGHEPIKATQTKSFLFGRPQLSLPSVFIYIGHIRKKDGFFGMYRGLIPKLATIGASAIVSDQFQQNWPKSQYEDKPDEELTDEEKQQKALDAAIKNIMERFACIVITQPLHVVTIRAMASFVGSEEEYNGILHGLVTTVKENGILGLWSGLVPRLLGEAITIGITAGLTYYINQYVDNNMKAHTTTFAGYIASSLTYPFTVVTNCSIVSRSGLAAGYEPFMPFYNNWFDIGRNLYRENQQKRGSSLLFRTYTGPQVVVNNRVIPVNARIKW